eukprot:gene9961-10981_t
MAYRCVLSIVLLNACWCSGGILYRADVSNASERLAVCNDGSSGIYYLEKTSSTKWVIFLESGGACYDRESCAKRMLQEPYLTSSTDYPAHIEGEDILSSDRAKNFAYNYNKLLIPYCSSDLWLGNATISMGPVTNRNFVHFRGYQIFTSVIQDIETKFDLKNATDIVFAGSSAGGIGVLNYASLMKNKFNATELFVIVDSAWFINFDNMLADVNILTFINQLVSGNIKACFDRTLDYPCCLSAFCMITRNYIPPNAHLLAIISKHDVYILSNGLIGQHRRLINQQMTNKIISDTLLFSGEISHSVRLVKTFRNSHTIVTSCFQHTYFASSSLWSPGGLFYARSKTSLDFPLFVFEHFVRKERWNNVLVHGQTIQALIANFYHYHHGHHDLAKANKSMNISSPIPMSVEDTCKGVQCNPTCPRSISFQSRATKWPVWARWFMLIAYLLFTLTCLAVKILWIVKRIRDNRIQQEFTRSLYTKHNVLSAIGLPCCIPSNYIGLSCKDVSYSVTNEAARKNLAAKTANMAGKKTGFGSLLRTRKSANATDRIDILKGVNAYFNPGQMVAVMGPSGCGKTTLLDILTGRKLIEDAKGKVLINGLTNFETREWFKRHSGYVMQLATPYHEELTVRENLTYSALMRLPKDMNIRNKLWRVEQVLGQAGLNDYADVVVGSATGGGLSGGQKRRLCVAIQLLRVPSVLFLDEPTSGLDSASSLELLETLYGLTLSGRLVILTIHQPRIEIFHMFDRILFLSNGEVAYFGSPLMAPTMIAEALRETNEALDASNPADTIMDVLTNKKSQELIVDFYKKSGEVEAIQDGVMKAAENPIKTLSMKIKRYSSSLRDRLFAFDCRASKYQTRAQKLYLMVIFLLYGIALGSVYLQTDNAVLLMSCYQVFTCASQLFMASVIHTHFSKSMAVFSLEQAEGVGKPYEIVIHLFIRISAMSFLPLLLCSTIIYLCTVVQLDAWKFFVTTLIHVQLNHVWIVIIMLTAATVPRYSTLFCPMLSAVSGFAGGFLVPKPKMPLFYYWLFYINPTHWAFAGIMKMLISDLVFDCKNRSLINCQANMGMTVLNQFGMDKMDPFENMVILFAMLVILLGLAMFLVEMKYTNRFRDLKAACLVFVHRLSYRISKIPSRYERRNRHKDDDQKKLISNKDVEANGNCLPLGEITQTRNDSSKIAEKRNSSQNFLSNMLPIKVEPMLAARSFARVRPSTFSAYPGETEVKREATVSRSHSINERSSSLKKSSNEYKEFESSSKTSREVNAVSPRFIFSDNNGVVSRERSESSVSTDNHRYLSKYIDVMAKPHEVYCSAYSKHTKKTRRRSVGKRLPDDVRRSESVHIQRQASMLILAEKRKSMTAQLTGFGHLFAYSNELSGEAARKPTAPRRHAACGAVKRKIDTKRNRESSASELTSGASLDHLAIAEPSEEEATKSVSYPHRNRRPIIRRQDAMGYSDEDSNEGSNGEEEGTSDRNGQETRWNDSRTPMGLSSERRGRNNAERHQENISTDFSPRALPFTEKFLGGNSRLTTTGTNREEPSTEPVKVSSLKISRSRRLVSAKTDDLGQRFADRYCEFVGENRSLSCLESLGSIDELDEDDEEDVKHALVGEDKLAGGESDGEVAAVFMATENIRRSPLSQKSKLNATLANDFCEVSDWLQKNSLEGVGLTQGDDDFDEKSAAPRADENNSKVERRKRLEAPSIPFAAPSHLEGVKLVKSGEKEAPSGPPGSPGIAKMFSNAVYIMQEKIEEDARSKLDSTGSDASNELTMATRSNDELTSFAATSSLAANEHFYDVNKSATFCKREKKKNKNRSSLRKSNSFEFDLDKCEKNESKLSNNDVVKTRSFRRMAKKRQFEKNKPEMV